MAYCFFSGLRPHMALISDRCFTDCTSNFLSAVMLAAISTRYPMSFMTFSGLLTTVAYR